MKKQTAAQTKMAKVMKEYKAGTLNTGSKKGPVVKSQKQAVAIALSVSGQAKKTAPMKKKMK
jgi:hypothetical protein